MISSVLALALHTFALHIVALPSWALHTNRTLSDPAPGLVTIPGGRTRIGIDVRDIERMLVLDPALEPLAGRLIAETPRHEVHVDSFELMVSEVTQEQFEHFVRATGARPPFHWYEKALRAAAERHALESAHDPDAASAPRPSFDARSWWLEHWSEERWELAEHDRARPVVYVDWPTARAYARWAGLRLMTELEYQRAVRNDLPQDFAWGSDVTPGRFAATSAVAGELRAVGSFPAGKSRQGVVDLAGNAWEWTSSPYLPFEGYVQRVLEFGFGAQKHSVDAIAVWDAERRVVVGGSFQTPLISCRASVRRGTDRRDATGAIGLRCARHPRAGVDLSRAALEAEFDEHLAPLVDGVRVAYASERALCAEGWRVGATSGAHGWTPPDGYVVIEDHRHVTFTPVAQFAAADQRALARSVDEPLPLGFVTTDLELARPELIAGTYLFAWRAHGSPKKLVDASLRVPLDVTRGEIVVFDLRLREVARIAATLEFGVERSHVVSSTRATRPEEEFGKSADRRRFAFEVFVASVTRGRGFALSFTLDAHTPAPDVEWRD